MEGKFQVMITIALIVQIQSTTSNKLTQDHSRCRNRKADIVFLLDSSSSVWEDDFVKQLSFVNSVVETFEIGKDHIQVGIVTFTHAVHLNFHLKRYSNRSDLLNAIEKIKRITSGGGTDTGGAIQFARAEMFRSENGGRENVSKFVVVITDGFSQDTEKTIEEAHYAKEFGAKLFAIGVGFNMDTTEMEVFASQPSKEYVFKVDSYGDLRTIKDSLASKTCGDDDIVTATTESSMSVQNDGSSSGAVQGFCGGKPADIFFAIDMSNSIWAPHFRQQLKFVANVIDSFDVDQRRTRIGVISFSDRVNTEISLDNNLSKSQLRSRVSRLRRKIGGTTNTDLAIEYLRRTGFSKPSARPSVAHIAIIITDGQSIHPKKTSREAALAHQEGIYIFAVGVGNVTQEYDQELSKIASDPDENFKFTVDKYDMLHRLRNILAIKTCQIPGSPRLPQPRRAMLNTTDSQIVSALKAPFPAARDAPAKKDCVPDNTDLIFAYDAMTIGSRKSKIIRKAIVHVVKRIDMKSNNIRLGLISHYNYTDTDFQLKDFRIQRTLVRRLRHPVSRNMNELLARLKPSFSTLKGGRKNAKKMAVIFIDRLLHDMREVAEVIKRSTFKFEILLVTVGKPTIGDSTELCRFSDCLNFRKYHTTSDLHTNLVNFMCRM